MRSRLQVPPPPDGRSTRRAAVGLAVLASAAAVFALVHRPAPAAGRAGAGAATVVIVTAGRPSELAFTLSKSSALPWRAKATIAFKVRNRGALGHSFEVCAVASASATPNACKGAATPVLKPGASATLAVAFAKAGTYEYLSTVPGQAKQGMKGLIGVGVSLASTAPKAATTTRPSTTSTAPSGSTPASTAPAPATTLPAGDASAGATFFASLGCSGCHTLDEVRSSNALDQNLNATHPQAFPNGPLTTTQLADLIAYVNGT
jgi:uncharacterized cupredoxin-like copper-binding protein